MVLLLLGNLGAKFSETSFLHFKTYSVFYANLSLSSLDNNFLKKFYSNNFTLSSMFSFQNLCSRKRKAVHYTLVLFRKVERYIFSWDSLAEKMFYGTCGGVCTQIVVLRDANSNYAFNTERENFHLLSLQFKVGC